MLFFFFFSSRRRHTRSDRDWSSDVCSSDLYPTASSPQAWAAGTPVLLVSVLLGLEPDRAERRLTSTVGGLPPWAEGLTLSGIHAFGRGWTASVDRGAVVIE